MTAAGAGSAAPAPTPPGGDGPDSSTPTGRTDANGPEAGGMDADLPAGGGATATPALAGLSDLVPIGRGGDSTVYRAHQESPDRDVAVKVLDLTAPDDLRRFEREVRITVQLGRLHPNIMKVLDTRRFPDGRPCILMDFYEMGSTHDRLQATGPFAVADVVTIARIICHALGFAHSRNVLHRDVKPQNILILPTSYVLADFGIARPMDAGHTSSLDRLSYRHASPEVLDGQQPQPTDDLWSLGSTLQTLLTGRAPFSADDPADDTALAYLRRVRLGRRRPLPAEVPAALRMVIDRAMHQDRSARYGSAEEMMSDLRALDREVDAWAPGGWASDTTRPPTAAPVAEGPVTEGPVAVGPVTEGPVTGAPVREGPVTEAPTTERMAAQDEAALWAPGAIPPPAADPPDSVAPADPAASAAIPADPAESLAGIAPSVAGSLRGGLDPARAGIGPAADAAPTGLSPAANHAEAGSAGGSPAGTPPRVRARIVMLAGAMLVISAVAAYLIARPGTPPPAPSPSGPGSAAVSGPASTAVSGGGDRVTDSLAAGAESAGAGSSVPVAGGDLTIDDPDLRPTLLSVKISGNSIAVQFAASNPDIARVTLVDVTHHNIKADTGPLSVLGSATPQAGVVSGTLPAQDDADSVIKVVLVGVSADLSRRGLSEVRSRHR